MRVVVQRVRNASVTVDDSVVGEIGWGLCIYLGIASTDGEDEVRWMADKIVSLRIFEDDDGKMNRSLLDIEGEALVVSQFTLYGDCRKGRRPSFCAAADPDAANVLYERFKKEIEQHGISVSSGVFQAHMAVRTTNDGPVTILIEKEASTESAGGSQGR